MILSLVLQIIHSTLIILGAVNSYNTNKMDEPSIKKDPALVTCSPTKTQEECAEEQAEFIK